VWELPQKIILAAGHAEGITPLNAFDNSLLDAGIADLNLIQVSSILPPNVQVVKLSKQYRSSPINLPAGMLVPVVYTKIISNHPGETIAAAVGAGIPTDKKKNGVIVEYKCVGKKREAEKMAEKMIKEMFSQRKLKLKQIKIVSSEHKVRKLGCAISAALLLKENAL